MIDKALKNDLQNAVPTVQKTLVWGLIIVFLAGWTAMIFSTYETYKHSPKIPMQFVSNSGNLIMSKQSIIKGQAGFQKADLMDYGSIFGMGSYFGNDYTSEYLVQLGQETSNQLALTEYNVPYNNLSKAQQYSINRVMRQQLKAINLTNHTVTLPNSVATAITIIRQSIIQRLQHNNNITGWTKAYSLSLSQSKETANFLIYSSITTVAYRPGTQTSWTNNWPYEPSVGNTPTVHTFTWTWISLTILFLLIGIILAIYRIFIDTEDHKTVKIDYASKPLNVFTSLTPSQKATGKFFVLVAVLFLIQILVGSIMAHYYYDRSDFYGVNPIPFLPFNFLRTLHLLTPVLWIGLAWIASSLFLAPIIGGHHEPKGQKHLINFLFIVTLIIILGTVIGNYLGIMGFIERGWFWFGSQGLSYLELGRFWQILLFIGFVLWSLLILRAIWPTLKNLISIGKGSSGIIYRFFRIEYLVWYSSIAIAVIFIFGMIPLSSTGHSFTITDFWRWWVVHLWVEWAFELFASAMLAYFLMAVGLVSRQLAERALLFEWILIVASGVLGTGHHYFWVGEPDMWVGIGSTFSFLEVLPLFFLVIESIQQYIRTKEQTTFHYRLAFLYILGSTFWNFVGAGVFGGATINAPLANYYEHGTFLTLNHSHTAMFGAFGLLAIGLVYLVLRYFAGDRYAWSDRMGIWAFWLYNIGLVMWIFMNFFPIGWPQLEAVYLHGYTYARGLTFYNKTLTWQWLRLPGDVVFAIGALIMSWDFTKNVYISIYSKKK